MEVHGFNCIFLYKLFLGYFFSNKIGNMVLSQSTYVLNLLQETRFLGCKRGVSHIISRVHFWDDMSPLLNDVKVYQRLT